MLKKLTLLLPGMSAEEPSSTSALLRMSLEERKAYRREMLYQSIRECMLRLEALSSMYKFKVVSLDERHHRFIAMMDVTAGFEARQGKERLGFAQIEQIIRAHTYERYGVVLEGMFWRVDESNASFTRARRASDGPDTTFKTQTPIQRRLAQRLARQPYSPVSEKERRQFAEALRQGQRPPPLRVGMQQYQSDIAPLESSAEVGGTQFGSL